MDCGGGSDDSVWAACTAPSANSTMGAALLVRASSFVEIALATLSQQPVGTKATNCDYMTLIYNQATL
jgi:hypothetical protein